MLRVRRDVLQAPPGDHICLGPSQTELRGQRRSERLVEGHTGQGARLTPEVGGVKIWGQVLAWSPSVLRGGVVQSLALQGGERRER